MSTTRQFRRLLAILPHLAGGAARTYEELAERVGADWQTIRGDLYALSQREDAPGGFVEEVQLFLDERGVRAFSSQFQRPMRLTAGEAAALELGLALLREKRSREEREAIDRARQRVEAVRTRTGDDASLATRHVELTAAPFVLPDAFAADGRPREAMVAQGDPVTMTVRYSPRLAKWIARHETGELRENGSLVVEHRVADMRMALRHVLQFGPEAEVLEPAELREEIVARLRALEDWLAAK